jgi:galactose mutarotase-like enzyme
MRYSVTQQVCGGVATYRLHDAAARVEIGVAPARGAELCGLSAAGTELLHRAYDFTDAPGDGWYGHGQVLFPAVGRQAGGVYAWPPGARARPMPLHGWAKDLPFRVTAATAEAGSDDAAELDCVLTSADIGADRAAAYPWPFELRVRYRLHAGQLRVVHIVSHTGVASDGPLACALGNHITLRYPFCPSSSAGGAWEDGRLVSCSLGRQLELTAGSLLSGTATPRPEFSQGGLPLSHPAATNGVFGRAAAGSATGEVELRVEQPGAMAVTVTHEAARDVVGGEAAGVAPEGVAAQVGNKEEDSTSQLFVLWGSPPTGESQHGFICPEPWVSGPDSLNTHRGVAVVYPGAAWTWAFRVDVSAM